MPVGPVMPPLPPAARTAPFPHCRHHTAHCLLPHTHAPHAHCCLTTAAAHARTAYALPAARCVLRTCCLRGWVGWLVTRCHRYHTCLLPHTPFAHAPLLPAAACLPAFTAPFLPQLDWFGSPWVHHVLTHRALPAHHTPRLMMTDIRLLLVVMMIVLLTQPPIEGV